jgi:hypothetical protein
MRDLDCAGHWCIDGALWFSQPTIQKAAATHRGRRSPNSRIIGDCHLPACEAEGQASSD